MTEFMITHPWLFTFQVGFISLVFASAFISRGNKVEAVHHHYHYANNKEENTQ